MDKNINIDISQSSKDIIVNECIDYIQLADINNIASYGSYGKEKPYLISKSIMHIKCKRYDVVWEGDQYVDQMLRVFIIEDIYRRFFYTSHKYSIGVTTYDDVTLFNFEISQDLFDRFSDAIEGKIKNVIDEKISEFFKGYTRNKNIESII
jgi:predicted metallopeptidase